MEDARSRPGAVNGRPRTQALWKGTPIPDVDDPIEATPLLEGIADRIWWHGPPSIALRNSNAFVWQVIDYANDDDVEAAYEAIGRTRWVRAIEAARPGRVSRGSVLLWRAVLGLPTEEVRRTWPRGRHRNDVKMLDNESRERMYERHRRVHEARRCETMVPGEVPQSVPPAGFNVRGKRGAHFAPTPEHDQWKGETRGDSGFRTR